MQLGKYIGKDFDLERVSERERERESFLGVIGTLGFENSRL